MSIIINGYVPYPNYWPRKLAVSRATIDFVKELRLLGVDVKFDSERDGIVNWIKENKAIDLLSNPLVQLFLNAGISLYAKEIREALTNLVRGHSYKGDASVLVKTEETDYLVTSSELRPLNEELMNKLHEERVKSWIRPFQIGGINKIPIYLEHTSRIVACADLVYENDIGLMIEGVQFFDQDVEREVKNGSRNGCSISGLVTSSECMICHNQYSTCSHLTFKKYEGNQCTVKIKSFLIAECSIVKNPSQDRARIQWIPAR